ncbi:TraR/DksA C4-type zinc finger protein [Nitratireductor soli]|uniref:TraR/DksA C4-type zinc finger protein n=1 Tax=Nitratireductor soli TaxID=1670619 RepID=UPI00065E8F02|nr:TraR/DksA C4-type zinc finger protein [Nitratireductor soli]
MKTGNLAFELADLRAEQERQAGILRAQAALEGPGSSACRQCGAAIEARRREALPSAITCVACAMETA